MATLRRRSVALQARASKGEAMDASDQQDGDDGLQDALLPHDDVDNGSRRKQVILYQGPFDLYAFLASVVIKCKGFLDECLHLLAAAPCWQAVGALLMRGYGAAPLSSHVVERLEQLWALMWVRFDPQLPDHQAALRDLWAAAFPGEPYAGQKSERWKDMGWQGHDPSTDIRGAGLFGVQNQLYFAREYPGDWDRLLHKRSGTRAQWEYPFAAAGINLTFALADLLGLGHAQAAPAGAERPPVPVDKVRQAPAGRGFLRLLEAEANAFQEVYCTAFILLDEEWLRQKASYMQFNGVLKAVLARVGDALDKSQRGGRAGLWALHAHLGLQGLRD